MLHPWINGAAYIYKERVSGRFNIINQDIAELQCNSTYSDRLIINIILSDRIDNKNLHDKEKGNTFAWETGSSSVKV